MNGKVRAAVIGAGTIAERHVRAMLAHQRTELIAVSDIQLQRAKALAQGRAAVYADYKEMIRQERPDVVVITLPHYLHKETAVFSAEQKCHVLLEKPMAMNAAESREINQAAVRNGIVLAVGHMQHYFPANAEAKKIAASGQLGRLVMVHDKRYGNYFRKERPEWFLQREKAGGGVVINLGSHSIDKVQWITGREIVKVRAVLSYYGNRGDVEGSGCLFMLTDDHVPVTASICSYEGMPLQETELLFTNGKLKVRGSDELWISDGGEYKPVSVERKDAFFAQWTAMLDAIEHGAPLSNSGDYSAKISAVIDAAYRSHETGKEETAGIDGQPDACPPSHIFH